MACKSQKMLKCGSFDSRVLWVQGGSVGQGSQVINQHLVVSMLNENRKGRLVGYHRKHANHILSEFRTLGEQFSHVFVDEDMSPDGSRLELRRMFDYLRKDDLVVVESLHTLGYCFWECQSIVKTILEKECALQLRDDDLLFSPDADVQGQSLLRLLSAVARVEGPMLSGLLTMKAETATEKAAFKPNVRATVTSDEASRIQEMKKAGVTTGVLQEEFGLSRGAINRILTTSA